MPKKPISASVSAENVKFLRGSAARTRRSISFVLDEIITSARLEQALDDDDDEH
jgi:hypothetical protein